MTNDEACMYWNTDDHGKVTEVAVNNGQTRKYDHLFNSMGVPMFSDRHYERTQPQFIWDGLKETGFASTMYQLKAIEQFSRIQGVKI